MPPIRSVCVFCGSSIGANPAFADAARAIGTLLAQRNITLVYGGGGTGLMGVVADAALAAGGKVTGVMPRAMIEAERAHTRLTSMHVVDTMHQRKAFMADAADAFLALPGGWGTFDELFEIVTWAQLAYHAKPICALDVAGFYAPLGAFLDGVRESGFIQPRFRGLLSIAPTPQAALDVFAAHTPAPGTGWARPAAVPQNAPIP